MPEELKMRPKTVSIRFSMILIAAIAFILGGIIGFRRFCNYIYYYDLIYATAQFRKVNGIANLHIHGSDDVLYEVYSANFTLVGRPDAEILIGSPADGVVGAPEHLYLERLGPWVFNEYSYGYHGNAYDLSGKPMETLGCSRYIDIGALGEYGTMLPVKIRDLNDVVAHYDELVRHFSSWPDDKHWKSLPDRSGIQRIFCVSRADAGRPSDPQNFPRNLNTSHENVPPKTSRID